MQLLLAPMEGLLDFALRDTLTRVGAGQGAPGLLHPSGLDRCVSEFIRITDTLLPARAFIRTMPELRNGGFTLAGVPVRGQLLGSDPTLLAENAARLAELGSHGVDLNFGCPANVVNRHGGGSALLDDPELIHRIVAAVRRAVPPMRRCLPRCGWATTTTTEPKTTPWPSKPPGPAKSWCMPAPRSTATARPPTGSALPICGAK